MVTMNEAHNRYLLADSAFAGFEGQHSDADSGPEWMAYLEWAEATSNYLGHLSDTAHYWQQPVPELDRLRRVLLAQPAGMPTHPRMSKILVHRDAPQPAVTGHAQG